MTKLIRFNLFFFCIVSLSACSHKKPRQATIDLRKHYDSIAIQKHKDSLNLVYQDSITRVFQESQLVAKNKFYYHFEAVEPFIIPNHYLYFINDSTGFEDGKKFVYKPNKDVKLLTIQFKNSELPNEYFYIVGGEKVNEIFQTLNNQVISPTSQLTYFYKLTQHLNDSNFALVRMNASEDGHVESDLKNGSLYIIKEPDNELNDIFKILLYKYLEKSNSEQLTITDYIDNSIKETAPNDSNFIKLSNLKRELGNTGNFNNYKVEDYYNILKTPFNDLNNRTEKYVKIRERIDSIMSKINKD